MTHRPVQERIRQFHGQEESEESSARASAPAEAMSIGGRQAQLLASLDFRRRDASLPARRLRACREALPTYIERRAVL